MTSPQYYPPEILFSICAHVYASCLPASSSSLDPLLTSHSGIPTALPSAMPPGSWPEAVSRKTLASLCLVDHAWYAAAKPWLWRKLEVRLPRSWLGLVEEIAWDYDEGQVEVAVGNTIKAAALASRASMPSMDQQSTLKLEESLLDTLTEPDSSIPLELLSPVASRDPSPRRLRHKSKSPARWKIMRSINDAIQDFLDRRDASVYVPMPNDPRPGRFVRHLDFNHFRTIGIRRSVEEGVNSRFVTGDRVEAVLKECPNLTSFGATEYMDGALTLPVLNELFLRGSPSRGRGRPSRGRDTVVSDVNDAEEDDRERRRECREIEAIDLTGCVSAVFVNSLTEFVNTHLITQSDSTTPQEHQASRSFRDEPMIFPGLLRLGLRGVKSILPNILTPLVLSFPSLTHLDLSGTRATTELLEALGASPNVRLQSLALARCTRISSASIKNFLVSSPVAFSLKELNLYGDMTFTSPLTEDDLRDIVSLAPCFASSQLVYLDLSSSPLTSSILSDSFPNQPTLRSLGLSYIPDLPLKDVAKFIEVKAKNVEVLTLVGTSPELDCGLRAGAVNGAPRGSVRQSSVALHSHIIRPLCTPPFRLNLANDPPPPPPTRLRVIELFTPLLGGLGAGAGAWKIIRSKGGRGWYVDTASGWVSESSGSVLRRDLPEGHPYRVEMERLSEANGNVSSGVGWHARKMEILHGHGLNVLLVFIPVSWALNFALPDEHTLVFVFSFLAIIPLAKLLAFATDELSMRLSDHHTQTFVNFQGNAVELIVAIIALVKCELRIVLIAPKTDRPYRFKVVGSILSNLLLVLGMCFFAGGTKYSEQGFGVSAVQLNSSLLTISVIAVLLPAAYILALSEGPADPQPDQGNQVLKLSRGVAIILLFSKFYGSYLVFQLWSHATLYDDSSDDVVKSQPYLKRNSKEKSLKSHITEDSGAVADTNGSTAVATRVGTINSRTTFPNQPLYASPNPSQHDLETGEGAKAEEEEGETPQLSIWMTIGLLIVVTVLVAVTAEWLVDSIDGLTSTSAISKEFVGIILLPIVGNAAEHVTAVTVSIKDKLTLSLGVAVGSSICYDSFIITLGWILGKPLTLLFDPYESIALFLAVLTVNYVVQDGKSNWLEGMLLMCLYVILGVTFWFYPGAPDLNILPQCS
ncbi:hypothetical protein ONZ45_g2174 [Pleurotus djamor]|nr:hypothetical protein ONZ45_g2174 [Pleurotus djamor]